MSWWHFLIGMAVLLWGFAVLWFVMKDWQDRRAHERREEVWDRIRADEFTRSQPDTWSDRYE